MNPLTKRQLECLRWLALGKSAQWTAQRLGISIWTVREHLELARERLAARNSTHAVATAMRRGWLS